MANITYLSAVPMRNTSARTRRSGDADSGAAIATKSRIVAVERVAARPIGDGRWPLAARLVLIVGAPILLWALIFQAISSLT